MTACLARHCCHFVATLSAYIPSPFLVFEQGKQVQDVTQCAKGPRVGEYVQKLIEWQLENPKEGEEGAKAFLASLRQ